MQQFAIEYTGSGNLNRFIDKMSGRTWQYHYDLSGRLHRLTNNKGFGIRYTYNANGIRTSKTVDGITHTYTLDGTKILRETWGSNALIPLYDNEESVCGIIYNDVPYYFLKNLQGDIIAITNANGTVVAQYTYDAWGVPTIALDSSDCTIATINPYRYRGYYYDEEIGLYYVCSRYYDPEIGRWLNLDHALGTNQDVLSYNLFGYCCNNPINYIDSTGEAEIAIASFVGSYGVGLAGAALVAKLTAYATMIFPYLLWGIAIVVAAAVVAYIAYQAYLTSTKILSNVKAKTTNSKVFKLAYARENTLFKVGKSLSFVEALTVLGVKKAACSLTRRYKVNAKRPSSCKTSYWGMYSTNQAYAYALAIMLGCKSRPKVHGSGYYGHYHDEEHIIHIWYGYPINYR